MVHGYDFSDMAAIISDGFTPWFLGRYLNGVFALGIVLALITAVFKLVRVSMAVYGHATRLY